MMGKTFRLGPLRRPALRAGIRCAERHALERFQDKRGTGYVTTGPPLVHQQIMQSPIPNRP